MTKIEKLLSNYKNNKDDDFYFGKTVLEILQSLKEKEIDKLNKIKEKNSIYMVAENIADYKNPKLESEEFAVSKSTMEKLHNKIEEEEQVILKRIEKLDIRIEDYKKQEGTTFADYVCEKCNEKNIRCTDLYRSVNILKQVYSNIMSYKTKQPKFETCIQFIFGLELNLEEAEELLKRAGRCFTNLPEHQLIKTFIINKIYDIDKLNEELYKLKDKTIGCGK